MYYLLNTLYVILYALAFFGSLFLITAIIIIWRTLKQSDIDIMEMDDDYKLKQVEPFFSKEDRRSMDGEIADLLKKILDWDYTAYHGDVCIINIDKASIELRNYFEKKLAKEIRKNIV